MLAKKYGFKYLGAGVYRVAYKYKNCVVKTHLAIDATEDITHEYDSWKEHKRNINSSILNPVLYCKTIKFSNCYVSFSISPLVKTHSQVKRIKKHKKYNDFIIFVRDSILDGHTGNIGVLNKLPILIDYQDGDVCFDYDGLNKKDKLLFKKQRMSILSIAKKASA